MKLPPQPPAGAATPLRSGGTSSPAPRTPWSRSAAATAAAALPGRGAGGAAATAAATSRRSGARWLTKLKANRPRMSRLRRTDATQGFPGSRGASNSSPPAAWGRVTGPGHHGPVEGDCLLHSLHTWQASQATPRHAMPRHTMPRHATPITPQSLHHSACEART